MVNWGVISTANINKRLLAGVRLAENATALAVASRDAERARAYAREHEIERAYGSYEELLADPDVEVVYVSLPNGLHVEWSRRALEAGKHVLCEKPLSRHPHEVQELYDLAQARGLHLMEAFMYRHNPQTLRLKELVESGRIGKLRLIRSHFSFNALPGDVRLTQALEGGSLMDVGCYPVSMARLLAGEPERVWAEQVIGGEGVDVVLAATLRFPGDVLCHIDSSLAAPDRYEVEVVGSEAVLYVADPWHVFEPGIELRRDGAEPEIISVPVNVPMVDSYQGEVSNLSDAVRGLHAPRLGRADALGQARTIDALYRSAATGQAVTL